MRRSSRQLQFGLADRQSPESGLYARTEPPSVEPLTPIQSDHEAAALVASRLDFAVLITKLINFSKDTDTLKQTLLSFPSSEWENLQASLEKVLQCCQALYATDQDKDDQISVSEEYKAPVEDFHDSRSNTDAPDRLEDGQEVEQVQLQRFASEPDDETGDNNLSIEPEDRIEDYQSPEEIQSEKDAFDDEIEDSQSPGETEEDGATGAEHEIENSLPLEEDELHSGHAPDDTLPAGVEAQHESESVPYDSLLDLVDVDAQDPFWTMPSPIDDDIPVTAGSPESKAPPGTPQESPSKYTATTLVGSSPQNPPPKAGKLHQHTLLSVLRIPLLEARFSVLGNSQDNIQQVWNSLRGERETTTYSDGSDWVKLVAAADTDRDKSSIFSALATMAFFRWHRDQTQLEVRKIEEEELTFAISKKTKNLEKAASKNVTKRFPSERRAYINKKLTRGRRWSRIVDGLGFGILFKYTWAFGKATENSLEQFIPALKEFTGKMFVLRQLETQLEIFVSTGRTNIVIMEQALLTKGFLKLSPQSVSQEVSHLQQSIRESVAGPMNEPSGMDRLYLKIRDLDWGFYFAILERLKEEIWFSGDLIQLCMHLADKLLCMRVGFTVSIHDDKTGSALQQPLKWAAQQVKTWKKQVKTWEIRPAADVRLVCFFPLHLRNNHFALLEINEIDQHIDCYDTGGYDIGVVEAACKTEFPHLPFREQSIPGRNDGTSCGPCVVAIARQRMMCRPVENLGRHDALQLRLDALHLIRNAWDSKVLIPVPGDDRDVEDDICMLIEATDLEAEKHTGAEKSHPPTQRKRKRGTVGNAYAAPKTRRKARKVG
ncbi:uncharacterized protein PG998_000753 [Apiospora kogelbergensis]|uniref:uncharacterized protein n=1 Tax=Apiospora kogelbergensis TaxID=1337665 RepID=UPI0031319191